MAKGRAKAGKGGKPMTNVELPKPDLPPPAALALALMYFKNADLDEISAELRKRFPGYRGDAIRVLLDRKIILRGEKAEDGYWHFYPSNMPQAYHIFWEKPRNPRVGYGEEHSIHFQLLKVKTRLLLLEGCYVFLDLGEEARRLPDIIAYYSKSSREWNGVLAFECESNPIKHPALVRENLAKCHDLGLRVHFITSSERMADRIIEIATEEERFHPGVCDKVVGWFEISGAEKLPGERRVLLSAEAQLQKIEDLRKEGFHIRAHQLKDQMYVAGRKSVDGRSIEKGCGKVTAELIGLLEKRGDPLLEMIRRKTQRSREASKHAKQHIAVKK